MTIHDKSRSIRLYNVQAREDKILLNSRRSKTREREKKMKKKGGGPERYTSSSGVISWLWEVNYCRCKKKKIPSLSSSDRRDTRKERLETRGFSFCPSILYFISRKDRPITHQLERENFLFSYFAASFEAKVNPIVKLNQSSIVEHPRENETKVTVVTVDSSRPQSTRKHHLPQR